MPTSPFHLCIPASCVVLLEVSLGGRGGCCVRGGAGCYGGDIDPVVAAAADVAVAESEGAADAVIAAAAEAREAIVDASCHLTRGGGSGGRAGGRDTDEAAVAETRIRQSGATPGLAAVVRAAGQLRL